MDKTSNTYVIGFATATCVILATCLAATFNGLKQRIDENVLFDKQRNVLIACGLYDPAAPKPQAELAKMFADKVEVVVLEFFKSDVTTKVRVRGKLTDQTKKKITRAEKTDIELADMAKAARVGHRVLSEVYIADDGGEKIYCIPISGYGLWSTLYGFLALEDDKNTVAGITFYKHGETPGLGGEVDKAWWKDPWKGKKTHDAAGKLVSVKVLKGRGNQTDAHQVDGISGATITCNGVSAFVARDLAKYEVYFKGQ